MRLRSLVVLALLGSACPHAVPAGHEAPPVADGGSGPTEAELLRPRLAAISAEATAVIAATDEALWAHWTTGAPLDLAKATAGHDALFGAQSLGLVRRARELQADEPRALAHLERWLVAEAVTRATAEESATVANLEATATFSLDGKEQAWRELSRLLLNEKSAVKRRALWAASLTAAERIDAALARRDAKVREALGALDVPSPLELTADGRELDLESLSQVADRFLSQTELAWQATLKRLSDAELKLPVDKLVRADLPRLLKVPAPVDAAFPKGQLGARGVQTLGTLGLYGRPGLTLELAEAAKKNPLPLTVAPGGSGDVRMSFRPLGGLRDQALLLSELGTALALQNTGTGRLETTRLGDPALAVMTGELLEGLLAQPAWLEEVGAGTSRDAAIDAARAQRLFSLRRAAGTVLARLETAELPEPEARARFVAVMSRALAVRHTPEDGVRWRIDTDAFLRAATQLKAAVLAEELRKRLVDSFGETWWRTPDAGAALRRVWAPGTSRPVETQLASVAPDAGAAVVSLEQSLPALVLAVGAGRQQPDAGVVAAPWPRPASLSSADGGPTADAGSPP